jgi:hypothetical protein
MGLFEPEELQKMRAPFPVNMHRVREGHSEGSKIRWFVYVDRSDVQDLLDTLFPGEWATEKPELIATPKRTIAKDGTITESVSMSATVGITIRDVTRWDGGESDDGSTKSALTNAFRRTAAYGWGIGRYLYDMSEQIKTEGYRFKDASGKWQTDWDKKRTVEKQAHDQFVAWYKRQFGTQATSAPKTQENAGNGASDATTDDWNETAVKTLIAHYAGKLDVDQIKIALGVKERFGEWTKGKQAAYQAVEAFTRTLDLDFGKVG